MRLGIDASNLLAGGGLTHLIAFLRDAIVCKRYSKIIVWAPRQVLAQLPEPPDFLEYRSPGALNRSLFHRLFWTTRCLHREALGEIDLLFVPGGLYLGPFRPFATMCQNMLPFDAPQKRQFGFSGQRLRLEILRILQGMTFRRAGRTIFLSHYARSEIAKQVYPRAAGEPVIPHGVDDHFDGVCADYAGQVVHQPPRFLYISTLFPYKYQLAVLDAVALLKAKGRPVAVDFVGGGDPAYTARVKRRINELGLQEQAIVHGNVNHRDLPDHYRNADGFLYASGCENFPIILVEAMMAGLPILSSDMGPMREVLDDAACYFDPRSGETIAKTVERFLDMSDQDRQALARRSAGRGRTYTWETCFSETARALQGALAENTDAGERTDV